MSFFTAVAKAINGTPEEHARTLAEAWNKVKRFDNEHLIDVCKHIANSPEGKFGLVVLYTRSPHVAAEVEKEPGTHVRLLTSLLHNRLVMMSTLEELKDLRTALKSVLRNIDPSGDY